MEIREVMGNNNGVVGKMREGKVREIGRGEVG